MSTSIGTPHSAALPRLGRGRAVAAGGLIAIAAIAYQLLTEHRIASLGLFALALALGAVFLLAEFGYTGAFRAWLRHGDGAALAAGILVALVAALVIVPVSALVDGYGGFIAPIGLPVIGGAALFGVGMQLANGCGSGTLYAAGGGSRRMWVTLPFFCLGGLAGSLVLPAALRLPALPAVSLAAQFGPWGGLAATLALGAALIALVLRRGPRPTPRQIGIAVLIGALAGGAFLLSGLPWGITTGLTLWGAKIASMLGADLAHTTYWSWDGPKQDLAGSILHQDSSLMDLGLILGATLAASWRGSFLAQRVPPARQLLAAALGGLAMGFGARLAFGCNIGALVGGIASGSLHGFVWFFAALAGNWLGIRLRPRFGLA
ncbi:MAG: YeeE/YedE family protein [Rhodospirillales bacterium]|nr:YeeE/YedE family protein [Rhodospirillales bacterium]